MVEQLRKIQTKYPKSYWNILKGNKNSDVIPIELGFFLYEHFGSLSVEDEIDINENINESMTNAVFDVNVSDMLNRPITSEEIKSCIKNLKNNKFPGCDTALNEYIKFTQNIVSIICKNFQLDF